MFSFSWISCIVFIFLLFYIQLMHFLVAKLLYNSLCQYVSQFLTLWANLIFSAAIVDSQLKYLVEIPMTYAHLLCTLFCLSVCRPCSKRYRPYFLRFRDFYLVFEYYISLFSLLWKLTSSLSFSPFRDLSVLPYLWMLSSLFKFRSHVQMM